MSAANAAQIVALIERAKAEFGPQVLTEPARLSGFLTRHAPQFAPQIKALVGALALGAVARIGTAADPAAEVARIAGDVVLLESVSDADAQAGAAIAAQLAGRPVPMPVFGPPPSEPAAPDDSWIGATEVRAPAAAPAQAVPPPPAPAPGAEAPAAAGTQIDGLIQKLPPALQNKWLLGGIAALAVLLLINRQEQQPQQQQIPQQQQGPQQQPPQQQPPQQQGPQQQPPQQQPQSQPQQQGPVVQGPVVQRPGQLGSGQQTPPIAGGAGFAISELQFLVPPNSHLPPPQIAFREQQNALLYGFVVTATGGGVPFLGVLVQDKSAPLWQRASLMLMTPGAQQPENISVSGSFQLMQQQNTTMRRMQITGWERNGLNVNDVCVVAFRQNVQDLGSRSFNMCLLSDNCTNIVGCGVVP